METLFMVHAYDYVVNHTSDKRILNAKVHQVCTRSSTMRNAVEKRINTHRRHAVGVMRLQHCIVDIARQHKSPRWASQLVGRLRPLHLTSSFDETLCRGGKAPLACSKAAACQQATRRSRSRRVRHVECRGSRCRVVVSTFVSKAKVIH